MRMSAEEMASSMARVPRPRSGVAHDGRPRTVYLFGEDHVVELDAEGAGGPLPVDDHPLGVVADVQRQVQRPVRPLRIRRRAGS